MPARGFIEMLNSGVWEDRNKAGLLVMVLTRPQPSQLLKLLRAEALQSSSKWRDGGMRAMRTPTAQYSGASPDLMKLASNNLFKAGKRESGGDRCRS